jgi:hypothetical protein
VILNIVILKILIVYSYSLVPLVSSDHSRYKSHHPLLYLIIEMMIQYQQALETLPGTGTVQSLEPRGIYCDQSRHFSFYL